MTEMDKAKYMADKHTELNSYCEPVDQWNN
jgi:hypothetical protein